jgi:cardiolipin synthase
MFAPVLQLSLIAALYCTAMALFPVADAGLPQQIPVRREKGFCAQPGAYLYDCRQDGISMTTRFWTIPNAISLARLAMLPFIVAAVLQGAWMTGLILFLIAGLSDGVDGFIARYFHQSSRLGAYLDPLSDKALTIAVFWAFAAAGIVPVWLLVLIVARDIAIVAGAAVLTVRGAASTIRALPISKINTAVLIVLAGWLLAANAFQWSIPTVNYVLIALVVSLTAVSAAAYVRLLLRGLDHAAAEQVGQPDGL